MAKKARKPPAGPRPPLTPVSTSPPGPSEPTPDPVDDAPTITVVRPKTPGLSPLVRAQEVELEIGLTVLGTVVGVLTGYGQNVPLDALSGNIAGAVEGGVVGALMGYSLGRTLFLSVRAQWISWAVLVALAYVGYLVGGLPGADAGAVIGTALVLSGAFGREDDDLEDDGTLPVVVTESSPSGGATPGGGATDPFLPRPGSASYPKPPGKLDGK